MIPLLGRSPCVVMFSGGRDSSAVLAVAADVARREGLPLPVPASLVFPDFPETDESAWQERVVRHLELPEWQRLTFGLELNLLGPVAQKALRRHGVVASAGGHQAIPVLESAGSGCVLTGIEGDGLFGGGGSAASREVLARRVPLSGRGALRVMHSVAPVALRRQVIRSRMDEGPDWLQPGPRAALRAAQADELAAEPMRWDRRVAWWSQRRYVAMYRQAMDIAASDYPADMAHPFLDPHFLASVAHWGGALGRGSRTQVMRALFGHLLPAGVLEREDKADFTATYWGGETKEFAMTWQGDGLPLGLIEPNALRETWLDASPDHRTALLLQAAWLACSADVKLEPGINCRFE